MLGRSGAVQAGQVRYRTHLVPGHRIEEEQWNAARVNEGHLKCAGSRNKRRALNRRDDQGGAEQYRVRIHSERRGQHAADVRRSAVNGVDSLIHTSRSPSADGDQCQGEADPGCMLHRQVVKGGISPDNWSHPRARQARAR